MKILKRFLLLIGIIPCFVIGGFRWILTGKDSVEYLESFICYCTDDKK